MQVNPPEPLWGHMPDLTLTVAKAAAVPFAAVPTIAFELDVRNADPSERIHTAVLRCQFQIEVTRRRYTAADQERLRDLFGTPDRWGQTLRSMLWTHVSFTLPAFSGSVSVSVPVSCTFDFNLAATKYFAGLSEGDIPLCLLFSGTVFYEDQAGALQVAPVSWDKQARYRLELSIWKEMMDRYYPNSAWLCLRRDVFDRLHQYKIREGIPTWEETLERILSSLEAGSSPGAKPDTSGSLVEKLQAMRLEAMGRT